MLDLRRQGWSFPKLGEKYGIDHSSVIWQVRKHGIKVKPGLLKQEKHYSPIHVPPTTEKEIKMGVVKINQGKNYAGYLKEKNIELINMDGWMVERKVKEEQ